MDQSPRAGHTGDRQPRLPLHARERKDDNTTLHHFHGFGWFFFPHLLGAGLMALFWLGLFGFLVWGLLRLLRGRPNMLAHAPAPRWVPPAAPAGPTATEILRQRYARGEIDAVTFEQMMERLQATAPSDEPIGGNPFV